MSEPLKLGVIGCGRMFSAHRHGFRALREAGGDRFRITALAVIDRDLTQEVAPEAWYVRWGRR